MEKSPMEISPAGGYFIAVDGGVRHVRELNITPDILIGDLDSISQEDLDWCKKLRVDIKKYPSQKDQTDFELALDYAIEKIQGKIFIFGAIGGRIDHTLANISLLNNPEYADRDIKLVSNHESIFFIQRKTTIKGDPGDIISLLPWGEPAVGVTTTGLQFPLWDETLLPDRSRGISNVMCSNVATIEFKKGNLLCVHQLLSS